MAVFFRGLSVPERVALTRAMTNSGEVLRWDLPGPVLDKHSTGGVGDTVSLALAPAVAACGGFVPMISGRGLGHTGGTLDKLDSIPGYVSQPDIETFRRVTREVGCAIIGQTADLAPADKRLYAIRDVTATVESIDLITASILSKKLAAGLQGLVMDVKFGSGAFMANAADARALAESLVLVANGAGLPTSALLTDMNEPLASSAGNALEVGYIVDYLTGKRREPRFHEVTVALSARDARSRTCCRECCGGPDEDRGVDRIGPGRGNLPAHGRFARRSGRSPRQAGRPSRSGARDPRGPRGSRRRRTQDRDARRRRRCRRARRRSDAAAGRRRLCGRPEPPRRASASGSTTSGRSASCMRAARRRPRRLPARCARPTRSAKARTSRRRSSSTGSKGRVEPIARSSRGCPGQARA